MDSLKLFAKKHKFGLLFFSGLFLIFLLPATDPDLGWHLRCGGEIWGRKGWCGYNQFSVFLENYSWANHSWLYQILIFFIFNSAGFWGLTIFNSLLMTLSFLFFYLAIKNYLWGKMAAIGLIIFLNWGIFSFGIRSQIPPFFFFNVILWLFSEIEKKPKAIFFLPLIMLFWANSHGSVIIGLILFAFFLIKEAFRQRKLIFPLTMVFLFSAAITFLNPFGMKVYENAWQHFAVVDLSRLIAEWVPATGNSFLLILTTCFLLFFYFLADTKVENRIFAFFILPFAFLALKARRNIPFYFLLIFYLFFKAELTKIIFPLCQKRKILRNVLTGLTAMLFLFFGFLLQLPKTMEINSSRENYCQKSSVEYPCEAIEFLKKQPQKGNIFNRYEWGGFLIWQLPEYKIFVDGRMSAWLTRENKSPYEIYLEILQNQPGWQGILDNYKINWILISPGTFMDILLKEDAEKFSWQEVYRDKISVIYKKI